MIIFGLVVLTMGRIGTGMFYCPQCQADREYVHSHRRRFFTLFFIPLIPLNRVGEVVICQTCKTKFVPEVLHRPTQGQRAQVLVSGLRAAFAVVLAASPRPDAGIPAALKGLEQIGAAGLRADDVQADIRQPRQAAAVPLQHAGAVLGAQGAEQFLTAAVQVATVAGGFDQRQQEAATFVGGELGLSPAHIQGVIAQVVQGSQARSVGQGPHAISDGGARPGGQIAP